MNGTYTILTEIFRVVVNRRSFIPLGYSCKILRDATPKSLVILDGEWMAPESHSDWGS
jgi:hypothetical protein